MLIRVTVYHACCSPAMMFPDCATTLKPSATLSTLSPCVSRTSSSFWRPLIKQTHRTSYLLVMCVQALFLQCTSECKCERQAVIEATIYFKPSSICVTSGGNIWQLERSCRFIINTALRQTCWIAVLTILSFSHWHRTASGCLNQQK